MRVVCAWCQRDMHGDPTDPCAAVSHSVCPSCTAQLARRDPGRVRLAGRRAVDGSRLSVAPHGFGFSPNTLFW